MEFETNPDVEKMEIEGENQFALLRVPSEISQKHALHMFSKKFSNFSVEESLIFTSKQTTMKSVIYSNESKRYFENFAILLVYSKSALRLYNIQKFYEDIKLEKTSDSSKINENYKLQLINEYSFVGIIQRVLLYEKYDQTFIVVALLEAKVFLIKILVFL